MAHSDDQLRPETAGELRQLIEKKKLPWTVDPRFRDGDRLPKFPRGGQEPPGANPQAQRVIDVPALLRQQSAPSNPFLRARWIELKLLPPQFPNPPQGSSQNIGTASREDRK